jgi:beta-glucanase (GH16 family)
MKKTILFAPLFFLFYGVFSQCKIDYTKVANLCKPLIVDDFNTLSTTNDFQWDILNTNCPTWYEANASQNYRNYYAADPDQVSVSSGKLHLKVARVSPAIAHLPDVDCPMNPNNLNPLDPHFVKYKTGMIQSGHKFRYGVYEFRAKMPEGTQTTWDTWPTLWLWGGDTEIDLFDGGDANPNSKAYVGTIDWSKQKPTWCLIHPGWGPFDWDEVVGANPVGVPDYDEQKIYQTGDIVRFDDPTYGLRVYKAYHLVTKKSTSIRGNNLNQNLSSDFHTYTVAWLPDRVTFYFDGREIYTIDQTYVRTFFSTNPTETWRNGLHILCNLQLYTGFVAANYTDTYINSISFDIDYVKVWELKDANLFSTGLDIEQQGMEMMHHEVEPIGHDFGTYQELYVNSNVSSRYGSIAVNDNDQDEIFFRKKHTDGMMRIFRKNILDNTAPALVDYNYPITPSTGEAISEIKCKNGIVFYVGGDKRIQFFSRVDPVNQPDVWWHGWVDDNWNDATYWSNLDYQVDIFSSGVFDIADNFDIYYKSLTGRLCRFSYTNLPGWYDYPVNITPQNGTNVNFVVGDLKITQSGTSNHKIAYRTLNNNVYVAIHPIGSMSTAPFLSFGSGSPKMIDKGGSILHKSGDVYFIGNDNFIHRAATPSSNASTQIYSVASPNERANSNLMNEGNGIHYVGEDGRFQYIFPINPANPMTITNTGHWWMEDHWTTNYFTTFKDATNFNGGDDFSASYIKSNNKFYYARKHDQTAIGFSTVARLCYMAYENCHIINPETHAYVNIAKFVPPSESKVNPPQPLVSIYPNPFRDEFTVHFSETMSGRITVYSLNGQIIKTQNLSASENETINLTGMPNGMYFVQFVDNAGSMRQVMKISKL